jgi:hypothetical protein
MNKTILKEESKILDMSVDIWDSFLKLERQHPDEINEMKDAVHRIQGLIAQRMIQRLCPEIFPIQTHS